MTSIAFDTTTTRATSDKYCLIITNIGVSSFCVPSVVIKKVAKAWKRLISQRVVIGQFPLLISRSMTS